MNHPLTGNDRNGTLKVLAVSTWYPTSANPTEAPFNHEHVKAVSHHHDVVVVHIRLHCADPIVVETYDDVRVVRLPVSIRRPWTFVRAVARLARELRTREIVHTMAFSTVLVVAPAWLFARRPWVHTEHWSGVLNPASVSRRWELFAWSRCALRLPHRVTGVTRQLAERLQEFARPDSTSVVPCVVDNHRAVVPRPLGQTLKLIAVGRVAEGKRPFLALDTVKVLADRGEDVRFDWVGGGPLEEEARAHAVNLGIADRVRFIGPVHPSTVFERIEDADIFFLPSAQENFFTAAAEALSADRPVVAAVAGGYDDYCTPDNSVLVEDATPDNLAEAILSARRAFASHRPGEFAEPIRSRFSSPAVGSLFDGVYDAAVRDFHTRTVNP